MSYAAVKPEMLKWARVRAGRSIADLDSRFKKLSLWERGEAQPTLKQLEDFARATHVPFGYLFLPKPPEERIPIPDMRTIGNEQMRHPSPNLLDTIYAMQRRQAWLREELIDCESEPLGFVGSAVPTDDPEAAGAEMRRVVGLESGWAEGIATWREALGALRQAIEDLGVMAVINGVVGNDTHRRLDVEEFRGFALSDQYAPLIFVNGADAKSAQMFTLAHELAHIWLGESALTDISATSLPARDVELWCDRAAAEFLVPEQQIRACWPGIKRNSDPFGAIARQFKVSPIVAARRAMDIKMVSRDAFFDFYKRYTEQERGQRRKMGGGDFYNNQNLRVGTRFALQVMRAANAGRVSFKEAYALTGLHGGTFQQYAHILGVFPP